MSFPKEDGTYEVKWEYISDKNPRVLEIPPGIFHGYKALQPESIMLYYLTEKYDPKEWANIIKESGAKYTVITTKHHDGFALWNSKYGNLNSLVKKISGNKTNACLFVSIIFFILSK